MARLFNLHHYKDLTKVAFLIHRDVGMIELLQDNSLQAVEL